MTEKRNNDGFTLLEVLMATIILLIVFIGTAGYLVNAQKMRIKIRKRTAANIEADSLMEQAFWAIENNSSNFADSGTCYMSVNSGSPEISTTDPQLTWSTDNNTYPSKVSIKKETLNNENYADIAVEVWYDNSETGMVVHLETKEHM